MPPQTELRWRIERFFHTMDRHAGQGSQTDGADIPRKCMTFGAISSFRVRNPAFPVRGQLNDPASIYAEPVGGCCMPLPPVPDSGAHANLWIPTLKPSPSWPPDRRISTRPTAGRCQKNRNCKKDGRAFERGLGDRPCVTTDAGIRENSPIKTKT